MKSLSTVLVSFILLIVSAQFAFAADGKIYPAVGCLDPYSSGNLRAHLGRIYNNSSTSYLTVECPVIKEHLGDGDFYGVSVFFIDRDPYRSVSCAFYTRDPLNVYSGWYTSRYSSSTHNSATVYALTFPRQNVQRQWGYAVLRCTLPPRYAGQPSYIVSYRVDE